MGDVVPGSETLGFCANTANIWQIVGIALLIFKIVIPILLIVLGIIDFIRAMMGSKDDEIKKSARSLLMRAIAGVVIFFIPTIVSLVMGLISNFNDSGAAEDWQVCRSCITNPNDPSSDCSIYAEQAW